MNLIKKSLLIIFSIIILIGCDQQSKKIAKSELMGKPRVTMLSGSVILVYAENTGGMLSFGSDLSNKTKFIIFTLFVGIALTIMLIYTILAKNLALFKLIAFTLIIGGGLGNLIDRIIHGGAVIDFIVLQMFDLSTGIFNAADMFVMIGMFIILIGNLLVKQKLKTASTE